MKKGSSYEVVANTIKNVYIESDTDLAGYESGLILTRNLIAHLAYYPDTDTAVKEVIKDSNLFRLLQVEGILDLDLQFIDPDDGEYKSIDSMSEAVNNIKKALDLIELSSNDSESENTESKSVFTASLMSAIEKMSR